MPSTDDESPFEKTFRLVCRLDDSDIDYVKDTAEWIRRVVAQVLALDPAADPSEVTTTALDMSTRGHFRLMKPEIVGRQIAGPIPAAPTA